MPCPTEQVLCMLLVLLVGGAVVCRRRGVDGPVCSFAHECVKKSRAMWVPLTQVKQQHPQGLQDKKQPGGGEPAKPNLDRVVGVTWTYTPKHLGPRGGVGVQRSRCPGCRHVMDPLTACTPHSTFQHPHIHREESGGCQVSACLCLPSPWVCLPGLVVANEAQCTVSCPCSVYNV
jgi:hypothetical protein